MKEILKQFKWLILFCLASPFIIYIILITPSPIGIVAREDVGAWMGYYGAILGGFMTLAGVWWTIKNQALDKDKEYFPVPLFDLKTIVAKNDDIKEMFKSLKTIDSVYMDFVKEKGKKILYLPMYVYNLEETPIVDLVLVQTTLEIFDKNPESTNRFQQIILDKKLNITKIIPKNTKVGINFEFQIKESILKNILDNKLQYSLIFSFEYKNKLGNSHSQKLKMLCDYISLDNDVYFTNKTTYVMFIEDIK